MTAQLAHLAYFSHGRERPQGEALEGGCWTALHIHVSRRDLNAEESNSQLLVRLGKLAHDDGSGRGLGALGNQDAAPVDLSIADRKRAHALRL